MYSQGGWIKFVVLSGAALVKLATEHLAGLKEPAEKLWEGAVERMFPAASAVKGDDPK
jgi:hypothetical protein